MNEGSPPDSNDDPTVTRAEKGDSVKALRKVTDAELPIRFDIKRTLGLGGMGQVFAAHDRHLGRDVAVKVLPLELRRDPEVRARFLREARSAAKLRHPGIVSVFDLDPEAGFIVMELVEGETLAELRNREKRLPTAEVRRIGKELLAALSAAHEQGIIHRDVKPTNVMIGTDGTVKLLDFGVATFSGGGDITTPGTTIGTPSYMPPEQLRGQATDARSDVYAAGVTLFELAVGSKVHSKGSSVEDPHAAVLAATSDAALARALGRALEPRAEDRFPSAEAFSRALDPGTGRAQRSLLLVGLTLLAVIGASAGYWFSRVGAGPAAGALALLPFEDGSGDVRLDFAAAGLPKHLGDELKGTLGVPVVSYYRLLGEVGSPTAPTAEWEAAATRAGATFLVRGQLLAASHGVDVVVTLHRIGGAEVWRARKQSSVEEIPATVRGLATQLARAAGFKEKGAAAAGARSFAFDQAMLRAHTALEDHRFGEARERLIEANAADPTASEPRYYTALVSWWTEQPDEVTLGNIEHALGSALSDPQRGFMEGLRWLVKLDHAKASAQFKEVLAKQPEDRDNLYGLAEAQYHGGLAREGIATYRRLCKLEPRWSLGLFHAMDHYAALGDPEGLAWLLARPDVKGDSRNHIWQVRAELARRDYAGAIKVSLQLLDAAPAGPMSMASLEVHRAMVHAYSVQGETAQAQSLLSQLAPNIKSQLALDRLGVALIQGGEATDVALELDAIADAQPLEWGRFNAWADQADLALALGPSPRLEIIRAAVTANSSAPRIEHSANPQTTHAMLAGTFDDVERLEQIAKSPLPEPAAVAQAFLRERAGDADGARKAWQRAIEHTTDGRGLIVEAWHLARNRRAAKDPAGTIAACAHVLSPRVFRWSFATTVGPCLLWTGEAQLQLGHPELAKAPLERLIAIRSAAPAEDPLVVAARGLLAR